MPVMGGPTEGSPSREVTISRPDKQLWPASASRSRTTSTTCGPSRRNGPLAPRAAGHDGASARRRRGSALLPEGRADLRAFVGPNHAHPGPEREARRRLRRVPGPADLAWLGNQAVLEFHPAPVRRDRLDRPDLLVVDIDPPEDDGSTMAVEVALLVLEVLDDLGDAATA